MPTEDRPSHSAACVCGDGDDEGHEFAHAAFVRGMSYAMKVARLHGVDYLSDEILLCVLFPIEPAEPIGVCMRRYAFGETHDGALVHRRQPDCYDFRPLASPPPPAWPKDDGRP